MMKQTLVLLSGVLSALFAGEATAAGQEPFTAKDNYMPHGLANPKYAYMKILADLARFDRWILRKDEWLDRCKLIAGVEAGPQ